MTRCEQTLSKAVKMVTEEYRKALSQVSVRKPMSYALYQVWRYFDQHEKSRLAERSEEDGKEET